MIKLIDVKFSSKYKKLAFAFNEKELVIRRMLKILKKSKL